MSRLKKIAIIVSMFLIAIMGIATISKAAEYTSGTVYVKDQNELYTNKNMFCLYKEAKAPVRKI